MGIIEIIWFKVVIRKGEDFIENEIKLVFWDNCYVFVDLIVINLYFEDGLWLLFEVKKID